MVLSFGFWIPDIKILTQVVSICLLKKQSNALQKKKQRHKDFVSF